MKKILHMQMLKRAAVFFSFIFHPLLMPTLGIVIIMFTGSYFSGIPLQAKKMLILLSAIGTFALPALMIPVFILRGSVSSLTMSKRSERIFPLAITLAFYLLTYLLFIRIPVYRFIHAFMLGSLLSVLTALVVTVRWKISTHLMGLGGLTALIIYLSFYMEVNLLALFMISLLAAGITATARLSLDAHTPAQVYAGFAAGFVVLLVTMMVFP